MTHEPSDRPVLDEELSAWLDGELEAERSARVRAQVEADPELSERAEAFRRVDAALRAVPVPQLPPQLLEGLAAAIDRDAATPVDARRRLRGRGWSRYATAAAALAAGLAVYAFVQSRAPGEFAAPRLAADGPASEAGDRPTSDRTASGWSEVPESDLAIALELDSLVDYDVIDQLDVLELLVALDAQAERG